MEHYVFSVKEGKETIDGKPTWSHGISVNIDKKEAIKLIADIARKLDFMNENGDEVLDFYMVGKLEEE